MKKPLPHYYSCYFKLKFGDTIEREEPFPLVMYCMCQHEWLGHFDGGVPMYIIQRIRPYDRFHFVDLLLPQIKVARKGIGWAIPPAGNFDRYDCMRSHTWSDITKLISMLNTVIENDITPIGVPGMRNAKGKFVKITMK